MPDVTALFWDVGGVLLSNGWDGPARRRAAEAFHLEREDFEARHAAALPAFETGRLALDAYLDQTVFFRPRPFSPEAFREWMFAQSRPNPAPLALAQRLARAGEYLMATLNNESLELNRYRIGRFGLRQTFTLFLSSCFVGVRKPDPAIYRLALHVTQRDPAECLVIDDRPPNLEGAQRCGMRTLVYRDPAQLDRALRDLDLRVG